MDLFVAAEYVALKKEMESLKKSFM